MIMDSSAVELPSESTKPSLFEILESAARRWPDDLMARKTHIVHQKLDLGLPHTVVNQPSKKSIRIKISDDGVVSSQSPSPESKAKLDRLEVAAVTRVSDTKFRIRLVQSTKPQPTTTSTKTTKPPQPSENRVVVVPPKSLSPRPSENRVAVVAPKSRSPQPSENRVVVAEYEKKLESSKRKLESGYSDWNESKKRSRIVVLDGPPSSLPSVKQSNKKKFGGEEKGKKPSTRPKWWNRLLKERESARTISKLHSQILQRQRCAV